MEPAFHGRLQKGVYQNQKKRDFFSLKGFFAKQILMLRLVFEGYSREHESPLIHPQKVSFNG